MNLYREIADEGVAIVGNDKQIEKGFCCAACGGPFRSVTNFWVKQTDWKAAAVDAADVHGVGAVRGQKRGGC